MRPELLLRRLDEIGAHLSTRPDAIALIGVGSVGVELHRHDQHTDQDCYVVVEDQAKPAYLDSLDWLEAPCPVAYSFANTGDGRKALYSDGIFCEYAVFTIGELSVMPYSGGRIVWQRAGLGSRLGTEGVTPAPSALDTVEHQLNEALTNLYVGLHRDLRGERLTAARFIQQYAVDRIITILNLSAPDTGRDRFEISRRVEQRHPGLPLAEMVPGYLHNRAAGRAILTWLRARFTLDPVITAAIEELL
jgi:hypothetical protein